MELASTSGLRVNAIDVQQIPPLGRRQVSVNAQVTRAGQFTVDAAVRTPSGGLLGPPSHLKVRSTAYGTITAWLTAIAGGLLVLLAARRVWRRVRGEAERPTARVAPTPPPTVDPTGPTVRLPIPDHGPAPPDRMSAPPDRMPTDGRPTAPPDRITARLDPTPLPPGPRPPQAPVSPDRAPAPAQAGLPTEPRPAPPPTRDRHRSEPPPGRRQRAPIVDDVGPRPGAACPRSRSRDRTRG